MSFQKRLVTSLAAGFGCVVPLHACLLAVSLVHWPVLSEGGGGERYGKGQSNDRNKWFHDVFSLTLQPSAKNAGDRSFVATAGWLLALTPAALPAHF
jgi:hypothetical protein